MKGVEARRLSDEEIICAWMEPKPEGFSGSCRSDSGWWMNRGGWTTRPITLEALWMVEERLTPGLRGLYYLAINTPDERDSQGRRVASRSNWGILHATPVQKIRALAVVLRPIVESR